MSDKLMITAALGVLAASPAIAQDHDDILADLSLEQLLELEVSSAAKKPQDPDEAASALFVITDEDLRKSGVSTLADALRMAPGVEVTEVDNRITGVAMRGFNWHFTNKLLVLIDGREVYQPSVTGIFWDQQVVPLEDIQRIEIVRGPSATIWGSTAVNGVINIVTKHAVDTLNGHVTIETSTHERHRVFARYGFKVGDSGAMRIYGVGRKIPSLVDEYGDDINDGGELSQLGFRLDLEPGYSDTLTFQGDLQYLSTDSTTGTFLFADQNTFSSYEDEGNSWNLLGRWVHDFSDSNVVTIQGYYNYQERSELATAMDASTFNIDASHYLEATSRLDFVYGAAYRHSADDTSIHGQYTYNPRSFEGDWTSIFGQVDIAVIPDRLHVLLGARTETSPYSDWETQPSLRAIWLGKSNWSVWSAISKAVRPPGRLETSLDATIQTIEPYNPGNPTPLPLDIRLVSDRDYEVEEMIAYEMGARKTWADGSRLDIAAYQQVYEKLILVESGSLAPVYTQYPDGNVYPTSLEYILTITNTSRGGRLSGLEASYTRDITDHWSMALAGDWRDNDLKYLQINPSGQPDPDNRISYGDSPGWQLSLRNDFELSSSIDASIWLRHVPELDLQRAPAYTDLDLRVSWRPSDTLEVSLVGENLLEDKRLEMYSAVYPSPKGYVERRLVAKLGLRF
ncbi:MAG: hypothetical protein CME88_10175 [Hirschia sp.]|nr:hypothetical protein [Hirschia sp.]MBF18732.1 hypothetical protein [Hirschia sp.]